jgi:hypothetical protein
MSTSSPRHRLLQGRDLLLLGIAAALVVVLAALVFQPWKLIIDRRVDEPVPGISSGAASATGAGPARPGPVILARGQLISHGHQSTGSVVVVRLPDGSRVLRLENLRTSDGPWLQVWLTDAPVIEGSTGWRVFDDGRHISLGDLKGNIGSSNYPIPADTDISQLDSVSIWCNRFNVSFAAAELHHAS